MSVQQQRDNGEVVNFIRSLHQLAGYRIEDGLIVEENAEERRTRSDRAALARLRRSLGSDLNGAPDVFRYVTPYTTRLRSGREGEESRWREWCFKLVGGLFALNPETRCRRLAESHGCGNFGASYFDLVRVTLAKYDNLSEKDEQRIRGRMERRFTALLKCRRSDLPARMRQSALMMKAQDPPIKIDWVSLLYDLMLWRDRITVEPRLRRGNPPPTVQRRWANAFWDLRQMDLTEDDDEPDEAPDTLDNTNGDAAA